MFPPANAIIYRNEAGEPVGWDVPCEPEYCDLCGTYHRADFDCQAYQDEDEDEDEDEEDEDDEED